MAINAGFWRQTFLGLTTVVPPLGKLPEIAAQASVGHAVQPGGLVRLVAGCLAFAGALLAMGTARFEGKDY